MWAATTSAAPCLSAFLMAAISFDGTLPVCSCAYVNICGWKGALQKSFFCLTVWAGFLYVFICILENLSVARESVRGGGGKPSEDLEMRM